MRKVAAAVKQLQDEMPQFITFGMSHYYSEPKRVRFQSEGGKFIDADAIATAFAETTVLQDECKIHHLMGDIEDNREHRDNASPTSRALMLDSTTVSLDYMPAIEILRNHGLTIAGEAD